MSFIVNKLTSLNIPPDKIVVVAYCIEQAGTNRAFRTVHNLGDFLMTKPIYFKQNHNRSMFI